MTKSLNWDTAFNNQQASMLMAKKNLVWVSFVKKFKNSNFLYARDSERERVRKNCAKSKIEEAKRPTTCNSEIWKATEWKLKEETESEKMRNVRELLRNLLFKIV